MQELSEVSEGKILIIDDEPDMLFLIQELLEPTYFVYTATDVEQANEILEEDEEIKVILCDYEMPDKKGLDYFQHLKDVQDPSTRILMTGYESKDLLKEALNSRTLYAFLSKPFTRMELLQLVQDGFLDWQVRHIDTHSEEPEELTEKKKWNRRIVKGSQALVILGALSLVIIFALCSLGGATGYFILTLLYLLKSFLGIDLFLDEHIGDFF